ncbi:hypothetical protein V9T40_003902 [Parthenolecanium corni]|uniref:Uncharacterized protein n=1 Tax=Parthenolecanium corni TaxID=536013 RepID=A0AAN9Y2X5_9HEMI
MDNERSGVLLTGWYKVININNYTSLSKEPNRYKNLEEAVNSGDQLAVVTLIAMCIIDYGEQGNGGFSVIEKASERDSPQCRRKDRKGKVNNS